jgi:hypothetical protein
VVQAASGMREREGGGGGRGQIKSDLGPVTHARVMEKKGCGEAAKRVKSEYVPFGQRL